jgi:hypothetical protein
MGASMIDRLIAIEVKSSQVKSIEVGMDRGRGWEE